MWLRSLCRYEGKQTCSGPLNGARRPEGRQTPKQVFPGRAGSITWGKNQRVGPRPAGLLLWGTRQPPPGRPASPGDTLTLLPSPTGCGPSLCRLGDPWLLEGDALEVVPDPGSWSFQVLPQRHLRGRDSISLALLGPLPPGITSNIGPVTCQVWCEQVRRQPPPGLPWPEEGWKVMSPEYPAVPHILILSNFKIVLRHSCGGCTHSTGRQTEDQGRG